MQRVIFHIDMNSYFASVEQQDQPAFRGRPVGVCEHLGGIIIAASVEAKRWGVGTGTPVWEARKICPQIILTKTHPDRYRLYSGRLMTVLADYSGEVEQYSIDEAFVDATRVCNITRTAAAGGRMEPVDPFFEAVRMAREIKARMKKEVGDWLRCSVGIGDNKLLAKIASDLQKPDGLTVILPQGIALSPDLAESCQVIGTAQLYERLALTDIPGIGKRQAKRLFELGIATLSDLRKYPESKLVTHFGIMGRHLHEMGQLRSSWKPDVSQDEEIKSIGHMYTLPREFREKKFFVPVLYKLSEMVARRLRAQGLCGSELHFHIHDGSHVCYGKSRRLGREIQDGREIFLECMSLFEKSAGPLLSQGGFKLIGVTVAGLSEESGQQSLFVQDKRIQRVVQSLDVINEKYGDFTVCRVPVKLAGNVFRDSIGFGRIKEHFRLAKEK